MLYFMISVNLMLILIYFCDKDFVKIISVSRNVEKFFFSNSTVVPILLSRKCIRIHEFSTIPKRVMYNYEKIIVAVSHNECMNLS